MDDLNRFYPLDEEYKMTKDHINEDSENYREYKRKLLIHKFNTPVQSQPLAMLNAIKLFQRFNTSDRYLRLDMEFPDTREFHALQEFARICLKTGLIDNAKQIIEKLYGDLNEKHVSYVLINNDSESMEIGPFTHSIAEALAIEIRDATSANAISYDIVLNNGIFQELYAEISI